MKRIFFVYTLASLFCLVSCNNSSIDKPSDDKMRECLGNELANKVIIESYIQEDGLTREKDGVKYYEGYFNADIKFIANYNNFKVGEQYKIIKGTVAFMKTENGWNCQSFDMSAANLVKIKVQGENSDHINSDEFDDVPNQTTSQSSTVSKTHGTYPQGTDKLLTASDISNLSKSQLKIMRNEIFARHGYIFKTTDMQQYFSSQTWYKPMYDDVDNALTNIEKNNAALIKKYE